MDQMMGEVLDRELIRELTARYAHGIAVGDGALVASLFTDDAIFETKHTEGVSSLPTELRGRKEIEQFYKSIKPGDAIPCVHNHIIRLNDHGAEGTCTLEVHLKSTGRVLFGSGYYNDTYCRDAGQWKFAHRICTFLYLGSPSDWK